MPSIDLDFCRMMLKRVHSDVKAYSPSINLHKDAWVYHLGRDHWEFHGPGNYYWHGSASNAYEARSHGWSRWLADQTRDRPELE